MSGREQPKLMEKEFPKEKRVVPVSQLMLHALTPEQVEMIDRALMDVGAFGEVRLVKVKGKLRYIQKLESNQATPTNNEEPEPDD